MRCRHTVPDWHRFAEVVERSVPIMAACRLLIKDGDRVRDPRSIACDYWGRQEECPLYEGPGKRSRNPAAPPPQPAADSALPEERVWPVRPPGTPDSVRTLLIALSSLSVALLIWSGVLGLTGRSSRMPGYFWIVAAVAGAVSTITHILALLRTWARR